MKKFLLIPLTILTLLFVIDYRSTGQINSYPPGLGGTTATGVGAPIQCAAADVSDAWTCTLTPPPASLSSLANVPISVVITTANTGAATFAPNSFTAKAVKKLQGTVDLVTGDVVANSTILLEYNSTLDVWILQGQNATPYAPAALTNTDIFVGNSSNVATDVALSRDCTIANTGAITCTKTNNVAFATSATTDTTSATNITSGTLPTARLGTLVMPFVVQMGLNAGLSGSSTGYLRGNSTINATEASSQFTAPFAGTLKNLYFNTANAQSSNNSLVATVLSCTPTNGACSGSTTGITATVAASAGAGSFSDSTHTGTVAAGDFVSIRFVNNANVTSAQIGTVSVGIMTQ